MQKFLLPIICLLAGLFPASAAKITGREALAQASAFFSSRQSTRSKANLSNATVATFRDAVHVVNFPEGGWALVAADNRVPAMVLGYSETGHLTLEALPQGIKSLLTDYAAGIAQLDLENAPKPIAPTGAATSVAPLLGDIAWNQGSPYNALCPEVDGQRAIAGCVTIAEGQIMYYHKFPPKGNGSFSYNWNGTVLSADFSKSTYQWDIMKPSYAEDEDNASSQAVAKLLYDIAVSNSANFGFLTGSVLYGSPLVEYFNYDPSVILVERTRCTRQYYEDLLRSEINAGRPVYIQAANDLGGGHAFVCDGYNDEGYFHFNMGGGSGGYFLNGATGWDVNPMVLCSIKPFANGTPGIWAGSSKEFYHTNGNTLSCNARGNITSSINAKIDVGLALVNKATNTTQNIVINTYKSATSFDIESLDFNTAVADGEYTIYPIYRADNSEWKKICFADNCADHVDVSIKQGVKTYTNFRTGGVIDDGVELINGIYYSFNQNSASVVSRNNLGNSYSGDVTIPATIEYKDNTYPVTDIKSGAFTGSTVTSIIIGSNVTNIQSAAFKESTVGSLTFAPGSNLTTVGDQAFYNCTVPKLIFPEGLKSVGFLSCTGTQASVIDFPASITYMGPWVVINEDNYLKDVIVHWSSPDDFPTTGQEPMNGNFDEVTLHVPKGCIDMYRTNEVWGVFGSYVDDVEAGIVKIGTNKTQIYTGDGSIHFVSLPEGETAYVYNLQGVLIGNYRSGETIYPGKGIYIVRVGKSSTKVIL